MATFVFTATTDVTSMTTAQIAGLKTSEVAVMTAEQAALIPDWTLLSTKVSSLTTDVLSTLSLTTWTTK